MTLAVDKYAQSATALQLRSMNMLYEMCMEGKSTMVFVPTASNGAGMPSLIGVKGIQDMLRSQPELVLIPRTED